MLPVSCPNDNQPGALGQGRGGGRCGTCPNCPDDNQPHRRGWRRATLWGGAGAVAGRHSTPQRRPALLRGCTGRGAAPLSSRRRRPPRTRYWSCTAGTWRRRALCVLDRVEGYGKRSSPTGGYATDHNPVRGVPSVGVEPKGSTPSLYYNLPVQFWE